MGEALKPLLDKGYAWAVIIALLAPHGIAILTLIVNSILRWREGPKPLTATERLLRDLMRDDIKPLVNNIATLADRVGTLISRSK
ncbi:MAG: hypothetical protein AAB038_03460 [Planctomycetota bacterium]